MNSVTFGPIEHSLVEEFYSNNLEIWVTLLQFNLWQKALNDLSVSEAPTESKRTPNQSIDRKQINFILITFLLLFSLVDFYLDKVLFRGTGKSFAFMLFVGGRSENIERHSKQMLKSMCS